jgi:hypothetical protein
VQEIVDPAQGLDPDRAGPVSILGCGSYAGRGVLAPDRALNAESPLRPTRSSKTGDEFKYQLEVYSVTGI